MSDFNYEDAYYAEMNRYEAMKDNRDVLREQLDGLVAWIESWMFCPSCGRRCDVPHREYCKFECVIDDIRGK